MAGRRFYELVSAHPFPVCVCKSEDDHELAGREYDPMHSDCQKPGKATVVPAAPWAYQIWFTSHLI